MWMLRVKERQIQRNVYYFDFQWIWWDPKFNSNPPAPPIDEVGWLLPPREIDQKYRHISPSPPERDHFFFPPSEKREYLSEISKDQRVPIQPPPEKKLSKPPSENLIHREGGHTDDVRYLIWVVIIISMEYREGIVWLASCVAVWCQSEVSIDTRKFLDRKFFHQSVNLTNQKPRAFVSDW